MIFAAVKTLNRFVPLLLIGIIIYVAQFYKLGYVPFRIWDESRLVTSAYEMLDNRQWLTPTVNNNIDAWSVKPPPQIWLQALCIKLGGTTETMARLPSALFAVLTILLVARFMVYLTGNRWMGLVGAFVLCTSLGFIGMHATRNAEYDSMLTFFTTAGCLSFFMYTESSGKQRNRYLLLFFAALTFGVFTKSIAGMLFTPALFVYLLARKQVLPTLQNRNFYLGVLLFALVVGGYYLGREMMQPGYWKLVQENELGGRFDGSEGPVLPMNLYWMELRIHQFAFWFWSLPISLVSLWLLRSARNRRLIIFCLLSAGFFFTVITISKTRHEWYLLPVLPLLAIVCSMLLWQMAVTLHSLAPVLKRNGALLLLMTVFSVQPIPQTYGFVYWSGDNLYDDDFYSASYYLREAIEGKRNLANNIYYCDGYTIQWRLYTKRLRELRVPITDVLAKGATFNPGDTVIVNQPHVHQDLTERYETRVLDEFFGVKRYVILAERKQDK